MPLVYRDKGSSGTQIQVLSGNLPIAHIGKAVLSVTAGSAVYWSWNFAFSAGPPDFQAHGGAETFEAAKAQVERNWKLWLPLRD